MWIRLQTSLRAEMNSAGFTKRYAMTREKMWAVAETVYTSDSDNILCNFYLRLYIFKIKKHQIAGIWHNLYLYYCQDKIVECRLFKKKMSSLPLLSNSACCLEVSVNAYIMTQYTYFIFIYIFYSIILFSFPSKNDEKTYHGLQKNIKQHNCLIADCEMIIYWAANYHIRMISEGSCDTEDWSNDVENSALSSITGILKYIQI